MLLGGFHYNPLVAEIVKAGLGSTSLAAGRARNRTNCPESFVIVSRSCPTIRPPARPYCRHRDGQSSQLAFVSKRRA